VIFEFYILAVSGAKINFSGNMPEPELHGNKNPSVVSFIKDEINKACLPGKPVVLKCLGLQCEPKTTPVIARQMISEIIIPVKPGDTFVQALSQMDEFRVGHLPVVDGSQYIGLLSEDDIFSGGQFEEAVGLHALSLQRPYVDELRQIFDVIRIFAEHKLTCLPVLDEKEHYLGVILPEDLIQYFANTSSIQNPGAVIVLERNYKDYSISEIAQIIESNDATILSLFVTSVPESTMLEITIKINRMDLGPVIQTLNRYNYSIKATYGEGSYYDNLKDRYDQLMTYLNI
jgi:CBS domain-containing protein